MLDSLVLTGNVGNNNANPLDVLGAPDSKFLAMGGPGAYVLLDMGVTPIVNGSGPDLEIREQGTAAGGVDEQYRVLISDSTDPASFVLVGTGTAFSLLDIAGTGLSSARYVRIEDLSTATSNSTTPGSDIESVTSLHASGSGSLPPVTGLSYTLTGNGVRLTWTRMTGSGVTGYNIRKSTDGLRFDSNASWTATDLESAFLDTQTSQSHVGDVWYAVSVQYTGGESALQVVHVPSGKLTLHDQIVHLGDSSTPTWEQPSPSSNKLTLTFNLPEVPRGPTVKLNFQLFDVDYSKNRLVINGHGPRSLPVQSDVSWLGMSLIVESGQFLQGTNTIEIYSRDSSGGNAVNSLDDFQIGKIELTRMNP
ncbi:hypothetical protein [Archangium lansingense]|uniref:F5/8 type C domain-containing protein n=1 Tax=Archangium lansingense TaxID=2995310 RepID=A0ABT4AQM4_9BACT|nr:hypothetical protein [Archangium lansinium]MCY1083571.1 hypothetical protein [Archangium lansinium]